jgi:endonuclease YncB( thermonuclease family)
MNGQVVKEASVLIKQGNRGKAKELLVEILRNNPENEQAWMLLFHCVASKRQKVYCLKRALEINPEYWPARKRLLKLQRRSWRKHQTKQIYLGFVIFCGLIIVIGALVITGIYPKAKAAPAIGQDIISSAESSRLVVSAYPDTQEKAEEEFTFISAETEGLTQTDIKNLPLPDIPETYCVPKDSERESGKVLQVLSADKILVELDDENIAVNYIGIDTSTLKDYIYNQAFDTNQTLENQNVILVQDVTDTTPDGNHPRYVFIGNTFVNYQLIAWGLGTAVNNPPDDSCAGFFLVAQNEAQDQRLGAWAPPLPEDWRDWPVVPEISDFSKLVYTTGLAVGTDPHAFSVIGDCQSLPNRFLARVDWDSFTLPTGYEYLQSTVDWFAGEYSRDFVTVRDSATVATMFSPLWADSNRCRPNETPLECEFRLNNPSVVLISLGTNWQTRSVEEFERYLRDIVEFSINHNVLPIIATKADATASDYPLNHAMARVAYDFDIPLWNFWSAVQFMPYQGMDPEDVRGIHILSSAYPVKRITALQVLHEVLNSSEN